MEADLHRYYQIDLLDLWRGTLSPRKIRVLVKHLPPESATVRALNPRTPEEEHWTTDRQLLAGICDRVDQLTYTTSILGVDQKHRNKIKEPRPIPRPGVKPPKGTGTIRFGGRHGSGAKHLAGVFGGAASA